MAIFGPTNMPNDLPGKVQFIGGFNISNNSPDYPTLNAADWLLGAQSGADYNAVIEYGLSIGVAVLTSYLGGTQCLQAYKHILSGVSAAGRMLIGAVIPEHEGDVFIGGSVSYAVNLAGGDADNHHIIKTGGLHGWDTEKKVQDYQQEDRALTTGEEFKSYTKNDMFATRKFKALMEVSSGDGAANSVIKGSFGFHISLYGSSNGVNGSGIFGTLELAPVRVSMYTETDMSFIRND